MSSPSVKIRDVCTIEKGGLNPQSQPDILFAHYSIPAFDNGMLPVIEPGVSIKSQKTRISNGAVLVSKLNPRIPRVWVVNDEQPHERICSTEFVPFQPNPAMLLPEFLFYALRRLLATGEITGTTSAATKSRERARPDAIANLRIPLPPLPEQRRIVDILSRAEGIVRLHREAQKKAAEIIPALFLDMFGDPATNPKGLPMAPLGEFLSFVTSGSRGWAEHYAQEGDRFIRSLDVRMNSISDDNAVFVNAPQGAEAARTRVITDDVLLTITGSQIGRVASVTKTLSGAYISQHVAILRLKPNIASKYLSMFLSLEMGGQREIARVQYGQTKPGLNLRQIREFVVPVPSMPLQQRFVERMEQAESIVYQQTTALQKAEAAFAALLARVFAASQPVPTEVTA